MKKLGKRERITQLVAGIFVIVAGSVFVYFGATMKDGFPIVILAGIMILGGPLLITIGALGLSKLKAAEKKALELLNDPSSLAFLTYGRNGGFKYYPVILDKDGQHSKNVAANVAGAASFLILGVGSFQSGVNSIDCFVSTDEIILNDKQRNPGLQDELFTRLNSLAIRDIIATPDKKYVKISIILSDGNDVVLHVPCDGTNAEIIRNDFNIVKKA